AAVFISAWQGYCKFKKRPGISGKTIRITKLILVGIAAAVSLTALWGGIKSPEVRPVRLAFRDLPVQADGLRIAVLSDIHAGPTVREERVRKFVELANASKADVILLVGDYLDGTVEEVGRDLEPLRDLRAPLGVFAVPGNHEYYYDYPRWRQFFAEQGIRMLENRRVELGNTGVRVAGITDPAGRKFKEPAPNLKRALAGTGEHFTILMSHRPKYARLAAKLGARLQLSGHTHGGSIIGLAPFVKNFNAGFVSGKYTVDDMTLLVCNGTGIWNGMPLRLGAPSEILLLELRRDQ
ncbi:MAG: metallophosphoesterase, partial [Lentisphaeria bacterium]|nr:metallophosphoesterase [Lentisphaeria bacterium]